MPPSKLRKEDPACQKTLNNTLQNLKKGERLKNAEKILKKKKIIDVF